MPPGATDRSARPRSRAARASARCSPRRGRQEPGAGLVPRARPLRGVPPDEPQGVLAEARVVPGLAVAEERRAAGRRRSSPWPRPPTRASAGRTGRRGRGRGAAGARRSAGRPAPGRRRAVAASWQRTITLGSDAASSARRRASAAETFPSSPRSRTVQARTYSPGCRSSSAASASSKPAADVQAPEPLQGEARVVGLAGQRGQGRPGRRVAAGGELRRGPARRTSRSGGAGARPARRPLLRPRSRPRTGFVPGGATR